MASISKNSMDFCANTRSRKILRSLPQKIMMDFIYACAIINISVMMVSMKGG